MDPATVFASVAGMPTGATSGLEVVDVDRTPAGTGFGAFERNRGLFWAACRPAEAGVDPGVALDALGPAAEHAGLPPGEMAVTTLRDAARPRGQRQRSYLGRERRQGPNLGH